MSAVLVALNSQQEQRSAAFAVRNSVECLSAFIGLVIAIALPSLRFIQTINTSPALVFKCSERPSEGFIGSWLVVVACGDPASERPS